jgi:hypothetical protein
MKSIATISIEPFTVRPEIAGALFGAPHLFQDMVKTGRVTPCFKTHRCTLYLVRELREYAEEIGWRENSVTFYH